MKKVLEDELMSLAHRILKLRNKAEIHELKEEAAVLYEKLSVLSFAEKHLDGVKPTIKKHDIEKSIEAIHLEADNDSSYPDGTEYNEEQIYEHNTEKIKDIVSQMPYETVQVDEMFEEQAITKSENTTTENDKPVIEGLEDFGVHFDDLPDFEPADNTDSGEGNDIETVKGDIDNTEDSKDSGKDQKNIESIEQESLEDKPQRPIDLFSQGKKSLNDSLNNELKIGLNDRLSFVNQLFKGDTKTYESFINHINKLESFDAVKSYLDEQIQTKYSYWKDKEDTANRLLFLIQKKFE